MSLPTTQSTRSISSLRCLLFDLDGVVYLGSTPLPGAQAVFDHLESVGIPYSLITNNSTKTARQYVEKLAEMGIRVPEHTVFTSAMATALWLSKEVPEKGSVYIIGEDGLDDALLQAGFWIDEESPRFVCVGLDQRLTYEKLATACLAIRSGARFIGANPDTTLPTERGQVPGCGAILSALETCTGVTPRVIGKPSPDMIDLAVEILGVRKEETAIVGDRLDTDILAGNRAGVGTIMVLTGVHGVDDLSSFEARPEWIVRDMLELLTELRAR